MTKLSIIILSYNTKDLLINCLESIYKNLHDVAFEVIVVDNASKDGTEKEVERLKLKVDNLKIIKNEKNLGFSKANNIGANEAQGKYLLFLNSDTKLIDNRISDMVKYMDEHKNVGIVGGLLKNEDRSIQRSYGDFYNLLKIFIMLFGREKAELIKYKHDKSQSVDWVTGAFLMIRRDLFKKLNGFDENFFMYIEDMELCYRVKKIGYEVWFYPRASIIHIGQGSSNRSFAIINIYKGLLYFYKKHKSRFEYFVLKAMLLTKAHFAIILGALSNNKYLVSTYRKAIQF